MKPSSTLLRPGFLSEMQDQYHQYLFDDFLPYMDAHIIDPLYGGFMCHTNQEGENVTTHKRTWYDGRGIWVYSFLYQYFGQDEKYLEVARKTVELVMKVRPVDQVLWPAMYTRVGRPLSGHPGDIYGGLFVAEGLAAFAAASGEQVYLKKAKEILFDAVEGYDNRKYEYIPHYDSVEMKIKAPRILGHWMVLLNLSRQILEQAVDPKVEELSDRCVDALLNHHLRPEFDLMIEYLNHDFSVPAGDAAQFSYIGHAIETLWMLMAEAERRRDEDLFSHAAGLFRRHVEVAWDDVYGSFFHCLNHVNRNEWVLDKVLWVQEEVMVGLLMLLEKDEDGWAAYWIERVWENLTDTFILENHPARLWINGGDRQLLQHHQTDRLENYHHPRHLMLNLLRLEKLI